MLYRVSALLVVTLVLAGSALVTLQEDAAAASFHAVTAVEIRPHNSVDDCIKGLAEEGALYGSPTGISGAILGSAIGAMFGIWGCHDQVPGQNTSVVAKQWTMAMLAELGNELNATNHGTYQELSALNLTQNAMDYWAARAALSQIGNNTFNAALDLEQSTVFAQLGQFKAAQLASVQIALKEWDDWYVAQMSGNGPYANAPAAVYVSGLNGSYPLPTSGNKFYAGGLTNGASGSTWIAKGSQVVYVQSSPCGQLTVDWTGSPGAGIPGAAWPTYAVPSPPSQGLYCYSEQGFPGRTGIYQTADSLLYLNEMDQGGGGYPEILAGLPGGADSVGTISLGGGNYAYNVLGPSLQYMPAELGQIATEAANTGDAYFTFLHKLGYYNLSSIPPGCVIPTPNTAIPPNENLTGLSAQEILDLYYTYLGGLGKFYNISLTNTSFCGHHNGKFSFGNATWMDLPVNATGYVYVPGNSSEKLGTPSTWSYHGQLLLAPSISDISVPTKRTWYPGALNPLSVMVNVPGQWVINDTFLQTVYGNSTDPAGSTNLSDSTSSPGYALYLQTCQVNNLTVSTCSVTVQTVNSSLTNFTCPTGQAANACQPYPSSIVFGLPGLGSLFSWLAGLFGGGLLGEILGALALVVIVVVAILVVVVVLGKATSAAVGSFSGKGKSSRKGKR